MIVTNTLMLLIVLTLCCLAFDAHAARVALTTKNSSSSLAAVGKKTAAITNASITAIGRANNENDDDDDADDDADDDTNDDDNGDDNGDANDDADEDDDATDKNANDEDDNADGDANDDIAAGVNAAIDNELKSEVQDGNDVSSVSVWSVVRGLWSWLRNDLKDSFFGDNRAVEGRTFGKIRRLQMMIIPLIFKFGLLTAMVGFLVLLGMKTIFLLKVLLFINIVAIFSKFLTLKSSLIGHLEQQNSAPTSHYAGGWATAPAGGGDHHQQLSKEIHLHIHGGQAQPHVSADSYGTYGSDAAQQHWQRRSDPYAAYDPAVQSETAVLENQLNTELNNEWNIAEPQSFQANKYPLNHRQY